MCGIAGIIGEHTGEVIEPMRMAMHHRGPDDSGIFSDKNISFIHSRLAIQDLSTKAHQPMVSKDGQFVIIFNGEIYNHFELRKQLEPKYIFRSTSDTETLLYGFIEFGKKIVDKINGIFSFAIYEKKSGNIFIARDPVGAKPLYYYYENSNFIFASEIKAFLGLPNFNKSICPTALLDYVTFLYSPSERTAFKKVNKLLPGHCIEINISNPENFKIKPFYDIPCCNEFSDKTERELINELEIILLKTIERQLLSDVPVGYFLSGGLDSSLLVAMTKSIYPDRKLPCFTISNSVSKFEGFEDDLAYARIVSEFLNVPLHEVSALPITKETLDKTIYFLDEPQADPAAFHVFAICEEAKKLGFKVLLGGIGADELFSGYRRHQSIYFENILKYTPIFLKQILLHILDTAPFTNATIRRTKKFINSSTLPKKTRLGAYASWLDVNTAKALFSHDIQKEIKYYNPFVTFEEFWNQCSGCDDLNRILHIDFKTYLSHNNLNYTDKMSMSSGVEVRVPYLDKVVIEFASKIPPKMKMRGYTTKYLLRKVADKYLPSKVIKRSKTGFGVPLRDWIVQDREKVISTFQNNLATNPYSIFDSTKVNELVDANKRGHIDGSYAILSLLSINSWMNQFTDFKD